MNFLFSPFIIPLAGISCGIVAIIASFMSQAQARRVKADQRMAMLARGMSIEDIERVLGKRDDDDRNLRSADPLRSLSNARRAGIVLCSIGIGVVVFFLALTAILHVREVLSGAAAGLIPLAVGIGFFIDYNLQKREMSRFGLELEPPPNAPRR